MGDSHPKVTAGEFAHAFFARCSYVFFFLFLFFQFVKLIKLWDIKGTVET